MSGSAEVPSVDEVISPERLQFYKHEYNLGGQLDLLLGIHHISSLSGRSVLEIGGSNIPRAFIFDVLKANKWISVDRVYHDNRILWPKQYSETEVRPIGTDLEFDRLGDMTILDGRVESLPPAFDDRFDTVVSIDAFEHVLRFPSMLDTAHRVLRRGGQLVSMFSPIWSSHIGHHLWGVTDKSGRTFYIESSPIPPWGHLLMRPPELYTYLLNHTDPETADEIVYHVYRSENLNRCFVEDYESYFQNGPFAQVSLQSSVADVEPPPEIQRELERLHPGRKNFSRIGFIAHCEK
jgi:SAM-dependent methyltransferase